MSLQPVTLCLVGPVCKLLLIKHNSSCAFQLPDCAQYYEFYRNRASDFNFALFPGWWFIIQCHWTSDWSPVSVHDPADNSWYACICTLLPSCCVRKLEHQLHFQFTIFHFMERYWDSSTVNWDASALFSKIATQYNGLYCSSIRIKIKFTVQQTTNLMWRTPLTSCLEK